MEIKGWDRQSARDRDQEKAARRYERKFSDTPQEPSTVGGENLKLMPFIQHAKATILKSTQKRKESVRRGPSCSCGEKGAWRGVFKVDER